MIWCIADELSGYFGVLTVYNIKRISTVRFQSIRDGLGTKSSRRQTVMVSMGRLLRGEQHVIEWKSSIVGYISEESRKWTMADYSISFNNFLAKWPLAASVTGNRWSQKAHSMTRNYNLKFDIIITAIERSSSTSNASSHSREHGQFRASSRHVNDLFSIDDTVCRAHAQRSYLEEVIKCFNKHPPNFFSVGKVWLDW